MASILTSTSSARRHCDKARGRSGVSSGWVPWDDARTRIAQIAPPWYTVPPRAYGGIELVVSMLCEGLEARGHDVTLFASGGSQSKAQIVSPLDDPPDASLLGNVWFEALHAVSAYRHVEEFDVIHDHSGIIGAGIGSLLQAGPPVVHTLHGPWTEPSRRYYALLAEQIHLVAISQTQRADNTDLRYAATISNGIDVASFPFCADKEDFLVYVGRSNPDKGPTRAIEIARRAGVPLVMVVKKSEPFERAYWDEFVAPMLTDDVEVYEGISGDVKLDLIARARAMVFPIDWPEPFGLVMIEAMACGTPVVASPAGAAVELIVDGVTGYLRESIDDLVAAVTLADQLDPAACRARVVEHFSADRMVDEYERLFERVTRRA